MIEKELILKLLFIDWSHNKKVEDLIPDSQQHLRDAMYINLFDVVLDEFGLPSMDYIFDKYIKEIKNKKDIASFYDFLASESEYYREVQADQSYEARIKRLKEGLCPLHGYHMTQAEGWRQDENGHEYSVIGCPLDNCVTLKYYSENKQELMPDWVHILVKWQKD